MTARRTDEFVSADELAHRYKVTKKTIWAWVRNGTLPKPVKFGKGKAATVRWRLDVIEAWDAKREA